MSTNLKAILLQQDTPTYSAYYNGKMSFKLHGASWDKYVRENFPDVLNQQTSENAFKDAIDLYAENIIPTLPELSGFGKVAIPFLCRGEAVAIRTPQNEVVWPERYEVISDGEYSIAAVFTRSLLKAEDYVTFVDTEGKTELFAKPVPTDLAPATREGYKFVERQTGYALYRFAMADKGMGSSLASLQDRINHSILDQTVIAEMYSRPFWYLLNYEKAPQNPYLPNVGKQHVMQEEKAGGNTGRIFTTSGNGPFGQMDPPTIKDMMDYHDSLVAKVSQSTGIPEYYFKPGAGNPPSGVALKTLSKRFTDKVSVIRDAIEPELLRMAEDLGVPKVNGEMVLWNSDNDLLQDALDAHGIALSTMGFPLEYIASVVAPGVDMTPYLTDNEAVT